MYRVADLTIDPRRFELTRDGQRIKIQPRAFNLLLRLVEARGAMVSKEEIFASVWAGRLVTESALSSQVKQLRKVIGDSARPHRIIETVHGQGLRIAAPVEELAGAAARGAEPSVGLPANEGRRPRVAVLRFATLSAPGPHDALAEGIPDEIIAALSKLRWLRVSARGSSFRFRSYEQPVAEVAEGLGVGYCLSGSVEIEGEAIALGVELADVRSGDVVWSDRYRFDARDTFAVRDEIVARTVAQVENRVSQCELESLRRLDPETLAPWEAYQLGYSKVFAFGRPDYDRGQRLFEQALEQDPHFARASAGLVQVHYWSVFQRRSDDPRASLDLMQTYADQAIALDPADPFCQLMAGRARTAWGRSQEGMPFFERAREISPSLAMAHSAIGSMKAIRGRGGEALPDLEEAVRLSPLDPWIPHIRGSFALAHQSTGDYAAGAEAIRKALSYTERTPQMLSAAVTIFTLADEREEADRAAREFERRYPKMTSRDYVRSLPELAEDLRKQTVEAFRANGLN